MTTALLKAVARKAEAIAPDTELLSRFVQDRDDRAFEELLRRHGPLVWAVCRQLLPNHADAEDAFQAVFLALVRSAANIRDGKTLPAWLHGVAVRIATRAKRDYARRKAREQHTATSEANEPISDSAWESLLTAVHEEVQKLPEAERAAFVLCELEGVSQPDAATRLGCPIGSLSGRLCRARQRLLNRLNARGFVPTVAIGVGLCATTANAVPTQLASVVRLFPANPHAASSAASLLVRGLLESVTMRLKLTVAALVIVAACGITGSAVVMSKADAQPMVGAPTAPHLTTPPAAIPGSTVTSPFEPVLPPLNTATQPQPRPPMTTIPPATQTNVAWEHKFVEIVSERKAFESTITQHGKDGWEYAGSERFDQKGLVLVFKKRKSGVVNTVAPTTTAKPAGTLNPLDDPAYRAGLAPATPTTPAPASLKPGTTPLRPVELPPAEGYPFPTAEGSKKTLPPAKKPEPMFQVFNLKFATAAELTEVLQWLFPEAKLVAEKRSNAIVVMSADTATLDKIRMLLGHLDVEVVNKPK